MFAKTMFFLMVFLINGSLVQAEEKQLVEEKKLVEEKQLVEEDQQIEEIQISYESPTVFTKAFITEALSVVIAQDLSIEDQEKQLTVLIKKYFNSSIVSKLVLGRYRKEFNKDQIILFSNHLEKIMVKTILIFLSSKLDQISEEGLKNIKIKGFTNVRTKKKGKGKLHSFSGSLQISENSKSLLLGWSVLEKEGVYKILDTKIDGISYILNARAQYTGIIGAKGVDVFISELEEESAN